jgi:hypothetical protein
VHTDIYLSLMYMFTYRHVCMYVCMYVCMFVMCRDGILELAISA